MASPRVSWSYQALTQRTNYIAIENLCLHVSICFSQFPCILTLSKPLSLLSWGWCFFFISLLSPAAMISPQPMPLESMISEQSIHDCHLLRRINTWFTMDHLTFGQPKLTIAFAYPACHFYSRLMWVKMIGFVHHIYLTITPYNQFHVLVVNAYRETNTSRELRPLPLCCTTPTTSRWWCPIGGWSPRLEWAEVLISNLHFILRTDSHQMIHLAWNYTIKSPPLRSIT